MGRKRWALLWLPLSLLAAERDPFQPVEDPCRTVQLSQWRYGGAAGDGKDGPGAGDWSDCTGCACASFFSGR